MDQGMEILLYRDLSVITVACEELVRVWFALTASAVMNLKTT